MRWQHPVLLHRMAEGELMVGKIVAVVEIMKY